MGDDAAMEVDMLCEIFGERLAIDTTRLAISLPLDVAPEDAAVFATARLELERPAAYPSVAPTATITRSRGLSEPDLTALQLAATQYVAEHAGEPVMFGLINELSERLLAMTKPSEHCAVCMEEWERSEIFKTSCFHFFHGPCIAAHVYHSQLPATPASAFEQPPLQPPPACPVCRAVLLALPNPATRLQYDTQTSTTQTFQLSAAQQQQQQWRQAVYDKQKAQGGLIEAPTFLFVAGLSTVGMDPASSSPAGSVEESTWLPADAERAERDRRDVERERKEAEREQSRLERQREKARTARGRR